MMRKNKIFGLGIICILLLASTVFAWGAGRSISDNDVTITVDPSDGTGIFTIQETINGATVSSYPKSACGLSGNILTCDYAEGDAAITYKTTGSGTISGKIVGGYPSTEKAITGDLTVPKTAAPVPCTANDWDASAWGGCSVTCGGGTQSRTVTKKAGSSSCTGVVGKPVSIQSCNLQSCNVPGCTVSDWTVSWGACSKECGGGTQTSTITKKAGSTCTDDGGKPGVSTQSCNTQACQAQPSCTDKIQNQAETGIDCGGPCPACALKVETTDPETYSLLTAINNNLKQLPAGANTLQKISAIASALKTYFG